MGEKAQSTHRFIGNR